MATRVILLNGNGAVGKDTFVSMVKSIYPNTFNLDSVGKVKQAAKILGWQGEKSEKARIFLSSLKKVTEDYSDFITNDLADVICSYTAIAKDPIVFVHIREPHNIDALRNLTPYQSLAVLVLNTNTEDITSNPSDASVYDYAYDYIIDNSGTMNDLRDSAKTFLEDIL